MPVGGSDRALRIFLRSIGAKSNAGNMDIARAQLNHTESGYEKRAAEVRERGMGGLRNARGEEVTAKVKQAVRRSVESRKEPPQRGPR